MPPHGPRTTCRFEVSARSWLFVPGDRPDRYQKALQCGADALILDLEDSVAEGAKGDARHEVRKFLKQSAADRPRIWVRINPLDTAHSRYDLAAVTPAAPAGIVLPKATSVRDVSRLADMLGVMEASAGLPDRSLGILPIVTETPLSIFSLGGYVGAPERLVGLTWGAEDLSAAIGASTARDQAGAFTPLYEMARALTLAGAAGAGVAGIETVYPDFRDEEGLRAYAARGRRDGFVGMMAIHPSQVAAINEAFTPSSAEIAQARDIVSLFEQHPGAGVLALDGKMVDAPHLAQARRILARTPDPTSSSNSAPHPGGGGEPFARRP